MPDFMSSSDNVHLDTANNGCVLIGGRPFLTQMYTYKKQHTTRQRERAAGLDSELAHGLDAHTAYCVLIARP